VGWGRADIKQQKNRDKRASLPKGTEESPAEGVEVCVAIVRILSESLQAGVVVGTGPRSARVAAQQVILSLLPLVPVGPVRGEGVPGLVGQLAPGPVCREGLDALVREEAHVHLRVYSTHHFSTLHKTQYFATNISTGKELRGCSPNSYIHVSVSDLCTVLSDRSAYSAAGK
jgi:hypothetical protein